MKKVKEHWSNYVEKVKKEKYEETLDFQKEEIVIATSQGKTKRAKIINNSKKK